MRSKKCGDAVNHYTRGLLLACILLVTACLSVAENLKEIALEEVACKLTQKGIAPAPDATGLYSQHSELKTAAGQSFAQSPHRQASSRLSIELVATVISLLTSFLCLITFSSPLATPKIIESIATVGDMSNGVIGVSMRPKLPHLPSSDSLSLLRQSASLIAYSASSATAIGAWFLFTSLLATTSGTFGALMLTASMSLRIFGIMKEGLITLMNEEKHAICAMQQLCQNICLLRLSSRILIAIFMLFANVALSFSLFRHYKRGLPDKHKEATRVFKCTRENAKQKIIELTELLIGSSDWCRESPGQCVPAFASFLIIFGGISILGCVTGVIWFGKGQTKPIETQFSYTPCTWGGIPAGALSIFAGITGIAAVHCCSAPLWQCRTWLYLTKRHDMEVKIGLHGQGHLLAITMCLLSIVSSSMAYSLESTMINYFALQTKDARGRESDNYYFGTSLLIDRILFTKSTLILGASLFEITFAVALTVCLTIDLRIRLFLTWIVAILNAYNRYGHARRITEKKTREEEYISDDHYIDDVYEEGNLDTLELPFNVQAVEKDENSLCPPRDSSVLHDVIPTAQLTNQNNTQTSVSDNIRAALKSSIDVRAQKHLRLPQVLAICNEQPTGPFTNQPFHHSCHGDHRPREITRLPQTFSNELPHSSLPLQHAVYEQGSDDMKQVKAVPNAIIINVNNMNQQNSNPVTDAPDLRTTHQSESAFIYIDTQIGNYGITSV